jgi:hypothetical protein
MQTLLHCEKIGGCAHRSRRTAGPGSGNTSANVTTSKLRKIDHLFDTFDFLQ